MSFPKGHTVGKNGFAAIVALLVAVFVVGFGLSSASAVTPQPGRLVTTNFVATPAACGSVNLSFDYTGGPDTYVVLLVPSDVQVASGSVVSSGKIHRLVTSQPAGSQDYAVYGSRGGQPAGPTVTVTIAPCTVVTLVTPKAPVFTDKVGTANDTVSIPTQTGVEYLINGVVLTAGSHSATGTVTVVARAKAGFGLGGTTQWSFKFTNLQPPTTTKPVKTAVPVIKKSTATKSSVVATTPTTTKSPATTSPTIVVGPKVVTDYVSDSTTGSNYGWLAGWLAFMAGAGMLGFGFLRRKVQGNQR